MRNLPDRDGTPRAFIPQAMGALPSGRRRGPLDGRYCALRVHSDCTVSSILELLTPVIHPAVVNKIGMSALPPRGAALISRIGGNSGSTSDEVALCPKRNTIMTSLLSSPRFLHHQVQPPCNRLGSMTSNSSSPHNRVTSTSTQSQVGRWHPDTMCEDDRVFPVVSHRTRTSILNATISEFRLNSDQAGLYYGR